MSVHYISKRAKLEKPAFVIEVELFKAHVGVFFSREDFINYCDRQLDIDDAADFLSVTARAQAGTVTNANGNPFFFIFFQVRPQVGTVAHESVHAATRLCEHLGVPFDSHNDETLAYMVDYFVQTITDEFLDLIKTGDLVYEDLEV